MPQLRKQLLEPLRLPTRFDPHSHGPLQPSVKGPHLLLSLVTQRPLQHLSRRLVPHDNLLIARRKITAYNLHRSAPSSRALVAHHAKSTRVQGADLVMKSNGGTAVFAVPERRNLSSTSKFTITAVCETIFAFCNARSHCVRKICVRARESRSSVRTSPCSHVCEPNLRRRPAATRLF